MRISLHTYDFYSSARQDADLVVFLHGLWRTRFSLVKAARYLNEAGFHCLNISYPSQQWPIERIVHERVLPIIQQHISEHCGQPDQRVHFLTHSLGGIVFRHLVKEHPLKQLGRAVLLAPPNCGSEILDAVSSSSRIHQGGRRLEAAATVQACRMMATRLIFGPVSGQLSTAAESFVNQLGPPPPGTAVIMGDQPLTSIFQKVLGPESDGIVTVNGGRLPGLADFFVLPTNHTFIMQNQQVLDMAAYFFQHGRFPNAR